MAVFMFYIGVFSIIFSVAAVACDLLEKITRR